MLPEVVARLRCPLCGSIMAEHDRTLRCPRGHSFDIARQGYVNLLPGAAPAATDTPEMVAARAAILAAGSLRLPHRGGDRRGRRRRERGTGVRARRRRRNRALPRRGPAAPAGRPRSRPRPGHAPRYGGPRAPTRGRAPPSATSGTGSRWPTRCADLVLDVFAPRNGAEFHRVLRPGGRLVVVTPTPAHLAELVPLLGLIGVDPDKDERLEASLGSRFRRDGARRGRARAPPRPGRGGRPRGHGPERLAHRPGRGRAAAGRPGRAGGR